MADEPNKSSGKPLKKRVEELFNEIYRAAGSKRP